MSILLTIYLAGMPLSLGVLLWAAQGAPAEDMIEVGTLTCFIALTLWVILWPLFLAITIYDVISER